MIQRVLISLAFVAAGVVFTAAYFLTANPHQDRRPTTTLNWHIAPTPTPLASGPRPTPDLRAIARLSLPSVEIDARVDVLGVDSDGIMQEPQGPVDVAWYNFSARPGSGGNVVIAGHVDYIDYGPAVFWRLRDVSPGDPIRIILDDGSTYTYKVASLDYYDIDDAPVGEIVGSTASETITLITCGGSFDKSTLSYDRRLVVRGTRV